MEETNLEVDIDILKKQDLPPGCVENAPPTDFQPIRDVTQIRFLSGEFGANT